MTEDEFIQTIERDASLPGTQTARAVPTATLRTLGERPSTGEAADLARHLPDSLAADLRYPSKSGAGHT